jgi:hypothetical protein
VGLAAAHLLAPGGDGVSLVLEVASGDELTRVTFENVDGGVTVRGGDVEERLDRQDVPVVIAEVIDLQPTGETGEGFGVTAAELDALVADGLVRMIVLRRDEADEAQAVLFAHPDLGYFAVERNEGAFEAVTVTALDVWTVLSGVVTEVLPA